LVSSRTSIMTSRVDERVGPVIQENRSLRSTAARRADSEILRRS